MVKTQEEIKDLSRLWQCFKPPTAIVPDKCDKAQRQLDLNCKTALKSLKKRVI